MSYSINDLFSNGLWAVIKAALILVLAFVVAAIAKSLVTKLLGKTKLSEKLGDDSKGIPDYIAKLVYLIVFLLFIPGVFSSLGIDSASAPVLALLNTIWGFVPNILGAAIIMIAGVLIARLVRELLVPVFKKIPMDKLQEKVDADIPDSAKLSYTLSYIVYVLILIPIIIIALHALNIRVISEPAINMLDTIFSFIPNIVVGIVVILIGCYIAKFGGQIVNKLIAASGLDSQVTKLTNESFKTDTNKNFKLSKAVGSIVRAVITIFFVIEGLNVLHLEVLTDIGTAIIGYMPYVLAAILILAIGVLASSAADKYLEKRGSKAGATFAKYSILVVTGFMILNQLGIATKLVNSAFILIIAALCVAFAVAFGIGGRQFAANVLKKLEKSLENAKNNGTSGNDK